MENETKVMSYREMLENAAERLANITGIPVFMANNISRPIWESLHQIEIVIDAMKKDEEKNEENSEGGETDGKGDGI